MKKMLIKPSKKSQKFNKISLLGGTKPPVNENCDCCTMNIKCPK